jgi:hypothetical protein
MLRHKVQGEKHNDHHEHVSQNGLVRKPVQASTERPEHDGKNCNAEQAYLGIFKQIIGHTRSTFLRFLIS